jgi:hypothetical protein
MAQLNISARASGRKGSIAARLKIVRQAVSLMALVTVLWSTEVVAQAVPPNCPSSLPTADIINHDFTVSFCELCGVGTVRLVIENPYRRSDDADFRHRHYRKPRELRTDLRTGYDAVYC